MEEEKKEKKYLKIGKRGEVSRGTIYECEYVPEWDVVGDGFMGCVAFKDEEIFLYQPDEICYMTEVCFSNNFEPGLPRWKTVVVEPPRESTLYTTPWAWTANEIKAECEKFLQKNPNFRFDIDEFAHYFFLKSTALIDLSSKIDPWSSGVSLLEAAIDLQKQKEETAITPNAKQPQL